MDRKEDRVENKHRRTREKGNMDTGQRQEKEEPNLLGDPDPDPKLLEPTEQVPAQLTVQHRGRKSAS